MASLFAATLLAHIVCGFHVPFWFWIFSVIADSIDGLEHLRAIELLEKIARK